MYRWLLEEQLSTRALARRLTDQGIATGRGAAQWQPTAVSRILGNPAYKGTFLYQRCENVAPARRLARDPYRAHRKTGRRIRPQEQWIEIKVPTIVDQATWEEAQKQLAQNARFSQRNNKRHHYLLKGLIRCTRCGGSYSGAFQHGHRRYRCTRADAALSSTGKRCPPGSIAADPVEAAVWQAITQALGQPEVLVAEYRRRLAEATSSDGVELQRNQIAQALRRIKAQEDRLTDAYLNEAIELDRYKAEMEKLRLRRRELEQTDQEIERRAQQEAGSRRALEHLEEFCRHVFAGLEALTFEELQELLRLLVERITVEG